MSSFLSELLDRRRKLRLRVAILLACIAASTTSRSLLAVEAGSDIAIEQVTAGFGGFFKVGNWSPVVITLRCAIDRTVRIVIEAVDPDEHAVEIPGPLVELTAGVSQRVPATFRVGRLNGEITVRVEDESGRVLAVRRMLSGNHQTIVRPALRQDVLLWATLGHPPGFESGPLHELQPTRDGGADARSEGGSATKTEPSAHVQVVHLDSAVDLPGGPSGYPFESLDALVLALGEKSVGGGDWLSELTPDHHAAIRDWVRSGGHLVLAAGARAVELRSSPLADWLPITIQPTLADVRQLSGLESFSNRNLPLTVPGTLKAARLDGGSLTERNVLVQGPTGPLLIRVPYGLGRVTFLGVDITQPPLSNWKALDATCRRIVSGLKPGASPRREQRSGQIGRQGITDLASQLHSSQDQFATIRRPSVWSVMGLIAVYIVLLGPLDYFVVQRLLGRSMLTWVTFPLLVCAASAASLWAAANWNGDRLQLKQVEVLDVVDLPSTGGEQAVFGRTSFNILSARTATYRVGVDVTSPGLAADGRFDGGPRISWTGVPEDIVGGMYRSGGLNLARRRYRVDESTGFLDGVPIPIWSSKRFEANWQHTAKQLVASSLASSGVGRLEGTISHALPGPLDDCMLAAGGRLYLLGTGSATALAPYQEWSPSQQGRLRDLKAFLTNTIAQRGDRTDKLREDIFLKETPYDPTSTDLDSLVRMLTFHQAAGGRAYTGMNHDLLRTLDLSESMQLGNAILIGRLRMPISKPVVDGQVVEPIERLTYVRLVVPVKPVKGDDR